ncbi:hypothetical protein [Kitasatospora sp. NPDC018619]|uniref:hypothetical protein n=1 Tax=unclassified Kitasatospora TaxID=2633591 RepID=UPI0037B242B6
MRLGGGLPAETVTALEAALSEHKVLILRGQQQPLDDAEQEAFARPPGRPVGHPAVGVPAARGRRRGAGRGVAGSARSTN